MRTYFRIVRGEEPTVEDFWSLRAQGKALSDPAIEREWAEGISVFDDFDRACAVSRRYGFSHGSYVVAVVVPNDADIEIRKTFRDRHHYTIYAEPERVLALAERFAVRIPDAPGEEAHGRLR